MMLKYLALAFIPYVLSTVHFQPEQIHLAYGDDVSQIVVTWSTKANKSSIPSIVEYGVRILNETANGSYSQFVNGGEKNNNTQYIHRVTLQNLSPGSSYHYRCGGELGWSAVYYFKTLPNISNASLSFAVYGDLGSIKPHSLPRLQQEAQTGRYDAVIHVGDFAYDLHTDIGRVGDEFMNQLEPVAAYVPYMTCPGNHEKEDDFKHYRARFSMPGLPIRLFYSYNVGPVHFISINTEVYYTVRRFLKFGLDDLISHYEWLEKDLQEANKPENRERHPWIITYGHRPMYSSNTSDIDDSNFEAAIIRVGLPRSRSWGLEKLFYNYGVDLEFWGHQHFYERSWPVYDGKIYNGSTAEPYTNPEAPVHIITGSAGAESHPKEFIQNIPDWSAFRSLDFGYTRLTVYNKTHIYFDQVSIEKQGDIIDQVWLIKDNHGRYNSSANV